MVLTTPLMQKTKKSGAKRFKLTARGKLMRRTPGFRHLLSAKSTKQKAAEKLVSQGEPITILSEAELVTMLEGLGNPQAQAEEDGEAANPPEQMAPGKAAKTDKKQGELF